MRRGTVGTPSPWILTPRSDLLLFIATPAAILPLFLLARGFWGPQDLYLVVAAFGAVGHHLPGMMRAYGDRALFARYRARFVAAPAALLAASAWLALANPSALVFTLYAWSVWHALMQTYGFARIYDAKRGGADPTDALLDRLVCVAGFVAGVLFSPTRMAYVLEALYASGGPLLPAAWIRDLRLAWGGFAALVAVAYLARIARGLGGGRRPSGPKLLLLAVSLGFWWYTCLYVPHLLVGILLFEVFHDVQYLAITWLYNRRRVAGDASVGRFTRFLFRRSPGLVALYVGLVFGYGSLRFLDGYLGSETANRLLTGFLAASGLLHFYYDGFIWKVRERETRSALGLEAGRGKDEARAPATPVRRLLPAWTGQACLWGAAAAPALFFAFAGERRPAAAWRTAIAELSPEVAAVQIDLATALEEEGSRLEAMAAYRRAIALERDDLKLLGRARRRLARLLVDEGERRIAAGDPAAAEGALEEAAALEPKLATRLARVGLERRDGGDLVGAERALRAALAVAPGDAEARMDLAVVLRRAGKAGAALAEARSGHALLPADPSAARLVETLESEAVAGSAPASGAAASQ